MSIKEKIKLDLENIDNQYFLNQIQMFVSLFKQQRKKGNKAAVLAYAGMLSDEDAAEMQKTVETEFSKIEGDWS